MALGTVANNAGAISESPARANAAGRKQIPLRFALSE